MWKAAFELARKLIKAKKQIDKAKQTVNSVKEAPGSNIVYALLGLVGAKMLIVVSIITVILVPLTFSLMSVRNTLNNIQSDYYKAKTLSWDAAIGFFSGAPRALKYEKYLEESFEIIEGKIQSKELTDFSDIQASKAMAVAWVYKEIYQMNFHSHSLGEEIKAFFINGHTPSEVGIWNDKKKKLIYNDVDSVRNQGLKEYINVFDIEAFDYVAGPLLELMNFDLGTVRENVIKENQKIIDDQIEAKTLTAYQFYSLDILSSYVYYNNLAINKANEILSKNNENSLDISGTGLQKLKTVLSSGDESLITSDMKVLTDNLDKTDLTGGDVSKIKTQIVTSISDFWSIYSIKDELSDQFDNLIKSKNLPEEVEKEIIEEVNDVINNSKYENLTLAEHASKANNAIYEQTKNVKQQVIDAIVDPKVKSSIKDTVEKLGLQKSDAATTVYRDALEERTTTIKSKLTIHTFKNTVEAAVKIVAQKVYADKLASIDNNNANGMYVPDVTSLVGNKNAEQSYNFLIQEGFSKEAAAACVGNWVQESSLDTTEVTSSTGAYGLCQWTDSRKEGLFTFASSHGGDASSLLTQLQYFIYETKETGEKNDFAQTHNGYKYPNGNTWEDFKKETDINIAVEAFRKSFERCGEAEANDTRRLDEARNVLAIYGNSTASTTTTATTTNNTDSSDTKAYYYAGGQQLIKWKEYYGDNKNNKIFEDADKWATEQWENYKKENSSYTVPDKKLSEIIIDSISHYSNTAGGVGDQQIKSIIATYLNLDCDFKIIDSDTKKPVANEQEVNKKVKEIGDDLIDCINRTKGKDINFAIYLLVHEKGEDRDNAFNGIKDMTDFSKFVKDSYQNTQNSNTSIPDDFAKVAKIVSGDKNINATDFFSISSNAGVNIGKSINSADEFYKQWLQAKITLTETYNASVKGDHVSYPGEKSGGTGGTGGGKVRNVGPYTGDLKALDEAVNATNQKDFAEIVAPYATYLYYKYGIFPGVQIADMINEGWNGSNGFTDLAKKQFNFGGVGGKGHYLTYTGVADFMEKWCQLMTTDDERGYYKYVASKTTPTEQMDGFSDTKYDEEDGQAKDQALMDIYRDDNLVQYDTGLDARDTGSGSSSEIVSIAEKYLNVPYVWGGTTPSGFDCSGFVQYVYNEMGITIPRTTTQQYHTPGALEVNPTVDELQPGDLIFYGADASRHVVMYIGDGKVIHAPSTGSYVKEVTLEQANWNNDCVGARRFIGYVH